MSYAFLEFKHLSFTYDSMTHPLFTDLNLQFNSGWTGVVGANGTGKSTLMKLAAGIIPPDSGKIEASGEILYCEQRTDNKPAELDELLNDFSGNAQALINKLHLGHDWPERWDTLSHGERKRAQIAVMLYLQPEVLALDEPTNHIDEQTRNMLIAALKTYRGVGLLVSHDREMLDTLCKQCLFIDPPDIVVRPGGVSEGMTQERLELNAARDEDDRIKQQEKHLKQEKQRRHELSEQAMAKNTKSGLSSKDHDQRDKIRLGRITGKDAVGTHFEEQMAGRLKQVEKARAAIHVKKEYETGIWLEDGGYSKRSALFRLQAGSIPLGPTRTLVFPELTMAPQDHIALTGPNGGGKTTLLQYILHHLNVESDKLVVVPQEITAEESQEILAQVKRLPKDELGRLMQTISRLGSRPQRLLESDMPSPGEIRKLLLALGITRGPHLIIMDEPTNHMDLPSILCLENALSQCPCGLLLVSHDRRFLQQVTSLEWTIDEGVVNIRH